MAIEMGHLDCAKWLVDVAGLQVASIEDWIYRTPFYAACETDNIEGAKWLIEIGGTSDILELKRLPLHAHKTFYSNIQRRIHNFHCDQYPTTSISSRSPLTSAVC